MQRKPFVFLCVSLRSQRLIFRKTLTAEDAEKPGEKPFVFANFTKCPERKRDFTRISCRLRSAEIQCGIKEIPRQKAIFACSG